MINIKRIGCWSLLATLIIGNAIGDENTKNTKDHIISDTHNKELAKEINGKSIEFVLANISGVTGADNIMPIKSNPTKFKHKPTLEFDSTSLYMYGSKIDDNLGKLPYFKPFINKYLIAFYNEDNNVIYNYGKEHNVNIRSIPKFSKDASGRQSSLNQYNEALSHYILTQAVVRKNTGDTCFTGNLVNENNVPYSPISLTNCKIIMKKGSSNIISAVIKTK